MPNRLSKLLLGDVDRDLVKGKKSTVGRFGRPLTVGENPSFVPTEKGGASDFPLPNNFFDGLPPEFVTDESLEDEEKQRVFTEGSQRINEVLPFELLNRIFESVYMYVC